MSHSIPEPQYGQPMTGEAPINVQQNINEYENYLEKCTWRCSSCCD